MKKLKLFHAQQSRTIPDPHQIAYQYQYFPLNIVHSYVFSFVKMLSVDSHLTA